MRGKLVPQDPKDEPASELLKRITKERARLIKEKNARRQEVLPEPDLDQAPFRLPSGWAWGRFPELGTFGRGKSKHRPRNDIGSRSRASEILRKERALTVEMIHQISEKWKIPAALLVKPYKLHAHAA